MVRKPKLYRYEFPLGGKPFEGLASVTEELKQRILDIDKRLELHEWPNSEDKVVCYLSKGQGGIHSPGDLLVEQFPLYLYGKATLPGDWLIDCLRQCDQWEKYKSREKATREQVKLYSEADVRRAEKYEQQISELSRNAARDVVRYGVHGKKHFDYSDKNIRRGRNRARS